LLVIFHLLHYAGSFQVEVLWLVLYTILIPATFSKAVVSFSNLFLQPLNLIGFLFELFFQVLIDFILSKKLLSQILIVPLEVIDLLQVFMVLLSVGQSKHHIIQLLYLRLQLQSILLELVVVEFKFQDSLG